MKKAFTYQVCAIVTQSENVPNTSSMLRNKKTRQAAITSIYSARYTVNNYVDDIWKLTVTQEKIKEEGRVNSRVVI